MHSILLDVFESPAMEQQLSKTLIVNRANLVPLGLGDVTWHCGHVVSGEHKTIEQLAGEMGNRLDEQLRKHCEHAEEVFLAVDGLVTPVPGEKACYKWRSNKEGTAFFIETEWRSKKPKKLHHSWEEIAAYCYSIWSRFGIMTLMAPTLEGLCLSISAMVYNSHKPEHNSLTSYVKHKPIIFTEDPLLKTWMGLGDAHIGTATAQQLKDAYGTPYRSFLESDSTWKLSKNLYYRVMKAIGRM